MAKSLLNFLTETQTNGIRTSNMFELEISSGYSEVDNLLQNITMYGQGFEVPDRTQQFSTVSFKGYPIPIPTLISMGTEHSISVNADVDGVIRRAFLLWAGMVTDPAISNGSLFAGEKRPPSNSFVRIKMLGQDMETVVETFKLIGVSVSSVGGLSVSNTDASVSQFSVGLKSIYWEIENHTSPLAVIK